MSEETIVLVMRSGAAVVGGWIVWMLFTTFSGRGDERPSNEAPTTGNEPGSDKKV